VPTRGEKIVLRIIVGGVVFVCLVYGVFYAVEKAQAQVVGDLWENLLPVEPFNTAYAENTSIQPYINGTLRTVVKRLSIGSGFWGTPSLSDEVYLSIRLNTGGDGSSIGCNSDVKTIEEWGWTSINSGALGQTITLIAEMSGSCDLVTTTDNYTARLFRASTNQRYTAGAVPVCPANSTTPGCNEIWSTQSLTPPDTSTRIINLEPVLPGETSTTTPTTSVTFSAGAYVNSVTPVILPDKLVLRANRVDQFGGFFEEWLDIPMNTLFATSTTLTLATSSQWRYYWQLLTPSDGVYLQSDIYTVNVVSNPFPGLVGVDDLGNLTGLATSTCSIGNIAGCFQNALVFAFYPNSEFLQGLFNSVRGLVAQKPPFGYINQTLAEVDDLNADGTPPYTVPFLYAFSGIFTPLRVGLEGILWFVALIYFYNRMKHIEP